MILEVAILDVIPGQENEFEAAFAQASLIISACQGISLIHCRDGSRHKIAIFCWSIGKRWKHIQSVFRVQRNIRNGEDFYITLMIHFRQLSIMS